MSKWRRLDRRDQKRRTWLLRNRKKYWSAYNRKARLATARLMKYRWQSRYGAYLEARKNHEKFLWWKRRSDPWLARVS